MRKCISFFLMCILFSFNSFALADEDFMLKYEQTDYTHFDEVYISKDGKYGYLLDNATGEAYFSQSLETDITVLRIPDEIDGHKIVGVASLSLNSPCLTRIESGKNVKKIMRSSSPTGVLNALPICTVVLNEGLEAVCKNAANYSGLYEDSFPIETDLKLLLLPKSLEYIGENGIRYSCTDNIIFQSDPKTLPCSVTGDFEGDYQGNDAESTCNVYITKNSSEIDAKTFCYKLSFDEYGQNGRTLATPGVTIYKKSGISTEDFTKEGCAVKKYTENFWENIKETEKVTLDKSEVQLKAGKSAEINASIYPTDAYDGRVFYVSLDEETASVDSEGKITALKDGAATIRVVAASGAYADCTVTVGNSAIQTEKSMNIKLIFVCALVADVALIIVLIFVFKKR